MKKFIIFLICYLSIILYLGGCMGSDKFIPNTIISFNDSLAFRSNREFLKKVNLQSIINSNFGSTDPLDPPYHTYLKDFPKYKEKGVAYEWWPILSGQYKFPTIQQPDMYYSGVISSTNISKEDVLFSHPFGIDFNMDVWPITSSEYRRMIYNSSDPNNDFAKPLHIEIESGLYPSNDFNFIPQPNDVIIVQGAWIIDAGHEPFITEIHPPSFMGIARVENNKTRSFAFCNPFRTTQLYNPDESLANKISDWKRFEDQNTKTFPEHFMDEILKIYTGRSLHLEAHTLIESLNPGVVSWFVSDTTKDSDGIFHCDYHFTKRSGVDISVIEHPEDGYVQIIASIGPNYQPAIIDRSNFSWPWDSINTWADENVKFKLYEAVANPLHVPHPAVEKDPIMDKYPPLKPLIGDNITIKPSIMTSDEQPFAFYGWVDVYHKKKTITEKNVYVGSTLEANPTELDFDQARNRKVTIKNIGSSPITIMDNLIEEDLTKSFQLISICKNHILAANEICTIEVLCEPKQTDVSLSATLHIKTSDKKNDLYINLKSAGIQR